MNKRLAVQKAIDFISNLPIGDLAILAEDKSSIYVFSRDKKEFIKAFPHNGKGKIIVLNMDHTEAVKIHTMEEMGRF
ncbi:MAG: hypothetical protein RIQ94_179 [Pseudomonadota bacterium]